MCGRFTLRAQLNRILQEMDVPDSVDWGPRYNIAPTQSVPVVLQDAAKPGRTVRLLRWGLVPFWAKDAKAMRGGMINARSETVAEQPAFRNSFRKRRCLVLADGYYEWQPLGKAKQPYFIHRPDNQPFTLAGLWDCWKGDTDTPLETFTIITTSANETTKDVHDRMPAVVEANNWATWLAAESDPAELKALLQPCAPDVLIVEKVGTVVNNARNETPECVIPI